LRKLDVKVVAATGAFEFTDARSVMLDAVPERFGASWLLAVTRDRFVTGVTF